MVMEEEEAACRSKILALEDCHRKHRQQPQRDLVCKHLNVAAALCLVSFSCPTEVEAVEMYCSSEGTEKKRQLCKEAHRRLERCLASHQE
eukprot:c21611_g2_i1 orf=709-978(-)